MSKDDLLLVSGGAGTGSSAVCTKPVAPKPQFLENSHAGPSTNDRIKDATNTLTSRGMSMFNDNRPSMPSEW